jgi:MSHA biogenesis protein MshJ
MALEQWQARYNQFSPREKVLVVLTLVVVVYMLLQLLVLDPVDTRTNTLQSQQAQLRQDIQNLENQQALLLASMHKDPDEALKQRLQGLKQQLLSLDSELTTLSVGLVPAKQLPVLLQDVLRQTGQLQLLGMQTLPVTNLKLEGQVVEDQNSEAEGTLASAGVFKHAVQLQLRGSYFQVLTYLEALEGLKWRFYWHSLNYEVDDYPKALVTLNVYTLSTEEGLFSG